MLQKPSGIKKSNTPTSGKNIDLRNKYHTRGSNIKEFFQSHSFILNGSNLLNRKKSYGSTKAWKEFERNISNAKYFQQH